MAESRIALCHEWVTTYGGSEQVAQRIADALDIRDVFCFAADPRLARTLFPTQRICSSNMGLTPFGRRHWQWLLPFMPFAWNRLDLRSYDVVVTSSHACVNAIRVWPGAHHISYCHTPMRYAWNWTEEIRRIPPVLRPLWPPAAAVLRGLDRRWAQRVTLFIANSRHVATRIKRYYGRPSVVIYPPVDTQFWIPDQSVPREDFFLFAGRLVAYKRADVAMSAAALAGAHLLVAGSGPELERLKRDAGPGVEFVPQPTREQLRDLYRRAKALVFPGIEDFGITLIEAQACGAPVIALSRGGAREAVRDGRTGLLYGDPSPTSLAEVLKRFDPDPYSLDEMRSHVQTFDASVFDLSIKHTIQQVLDGSIGVASMGDLG